MATWPAMLGAPESQGYSVTPDDATERTELADGPVLVRRVRSAPETQITANFRWTQDQWAVWSYFHAVVLSAGTAWFDGFPFLGPTGLITVEAQVRGQPKHSHSEAFPAQISLTLAIRALPQIDAATFASLTGG